MGVLLDGFTARGRLKDIYLQAPMERMITCTISLIYPPVNLPTPPPPGNIISPPPPRSPFPLFLISPHSFLSPPPLFHSFLQFSPQSQKSPQLPFRFPERAEIDLDGKRISDSGL